MCGIGQGQGWETFCKVGVSTRECVGHGQGWAMLGGVRARR
jgi:hypothetical protein